MDITRIAGLELDRCAVPDPQAPLRDGRVWLL